MADVWVAGNNKSKRVSLKLCSDNGHVRTKVVRLPFIRCPEFLKNEQLK